MHDCIVTAFSIRSRNQSPHCEAEALPEPVRRVTAWFCGPYDEWREHIACGEDIGGIHFTAAPTVPHRCRCARPATVARRLRCRGHACDPPDSAQESIALRARITGFSFCSLGRPASRRGAAACTECRVVRLRLFGELLQDSDVSEGEHVRDHRSNSIVVSVLVADIFTLVRNVPWIALEAGDGTDSAGTPRSSAGSRSGASPCDPGAQHCTSVGRSKGRKLEDHGGSKASGIDFLCPQSTG